MSSIHSLQQPQPQPLVLPRAVTEGKESEVNPLDLESVAKEICRKKKFAFGGRLGKGFFKETFLATHADGTQYALKIVKAGFRPDRMYREISAMQRCDHPNIARLVSMAVFDIGDSLVLYLLEKYLPGGSLAQRLKEHGTLPIEEVKSLGVQLSDAIGYLANLHLVHRDLEPDNILFGKDPNRPIITDFALVRDLMSASMTMTWILHAAPLYASPEQLNNQRELIDWRSDQFSLGVILSYCAFGFHPYANEGDSSKTIARKIAHQPVHAARFLSAVGAADLPVIMQMTLHSPAQRFATPDDLIAAWKSME